MEFCQGVKDYQSSDWTSAENHFSKSVALTPDQNEVYYYLSALALRRGEKRLAQTQYDEALRHEPLRLLREVARTENVELADVQAWLQGVATHDALVDPVHFSVQGNQRIADGVTKLLRGDQD